MHIGEYVKGGVATYLKEVIEFQKQSKDIKEVYLMLSSTNSEKNFDLPSKNIIFYDYTRSIKNSFRAILAIFKEVKRIKPDIVHVHSTFAGVFVRLPFLFRKKNYKIIYCSHGWSFLMETTYLKQKLYEIIEIILAFRTDKIVNISQNEHVRSLKKGFPSTKSILINNGIKEEVKIKEIQCRIDSNKINLLFVGRFDRQKGLDILIDLFNHYQNNNIKLYVVGDSILKNTEINIPSNVISLGWIDNDELDSYYRLFDAVIIPSRWEGFGLVAIEAMKNKKAIIVSNRGALPDLTQNNNGYVFDIEKLETLKEILNSIKKSDLEEKGINGYEFFNRNFTSERMNNEIISVYRELIN
ncbi:glycosyltransferase [Metabacillus sp. FJAT-53654]|uniref:Glycosyltransferase n=1 Tax=Metabacillus rhizosphaerae TaxID=3117747 RepID=A0ABZ2N0Z5_9BACI